uniref:(northern house mosquito) hypothetical protein n=1 Tax=Culex pipiens TaxID=7175 RepID=A0A8D8NW90_CULPI
MSRSSPVVPNMVSGPFRRAAFLDRRTRWQADCVPPARTNIFLRPITYSDETTRWPAHFGGTVRSRFVGQHLLSPSHFAGLPCRAAPFGCRTHFLCLYCALFADSFSQSP